MVSYTVKPNIHVEGKMGQGGAASRPYTSALLRSRGAAKGHLPEAWVPGIRSLAPGRGQLPRTRTGAVQAAEGTKAISTL